jgi:hypothetical protein
MMRRVRWYVWTSGHLVHRCLIGGRAPRWWDAVCPIPVPSPLGDALEAMAESFRRAGIR